MRQKKECAALLNTGNLEGYESKLDSRVEGTLEWVLKFLNIRIGYPARTPRFIGSRTMPALGNDLVDVHHAMHQ